MNAIIVMQREMKEKRAVIMAAIAFGLIPPFVLLFGKLRGQDSTDLASAMVLMVTCAMFFGVAAAAGSSAFSRELAEKRLSFYLARPISELSLWSGKMLAAILLPIIAAVIPLTFSTIAGIPWRTFTVMDEPASAGAAFVIMCFLVVLTHAASLGIRARSAWMGLQVATFAFGIAIIIVAARAMLLSGAVKYVGLSVSITMFAIIVALVVASVMGIMKGRSEIVVVQRYSAIVFSSIFLVFALAYVAYTSWVRTADRSDLRSMSARAAAVAPLVTVRGERSGGFDYAPSFLINSANGKEMAIPAAMGPIMFSNGGRVVWEELTDASLRNPRAMLTWTDLNEPTPRRRQSTLDTTGKAFEVSPDGRRVAIFTNRVIAIYELESGRQIAVFTLPEERATWSGHIAWVNDSLVRLYSPDGSKVGSARSWKIHELSLGDKSLKEAGQFVGSTPRFSSDEKHFVTVDNNQLHLADASNGATMLALPLPSVHQPMNFFALVGNRIVLLDRVGKKASLRVYDRSGKLEREIVIPAESERVQVGPQSDTVFFTASKGGRSDTYTASLVSGEVRMYLENATPVSIVGNVFPLPGSPATHLFTTSSGASRIANAESVGVSQLFVFDPVSRQRKVLAGRS